MNLFAFVDPASVSVFAYLDPATGSIIWQTVVGGLIAGIAVGRMYWFRIKSVFRRDPERK